MDHLDPAKVSRIQSDASSLSSRDRKALILKCQLALFSAYRIDQYADAEGFKNSLGAVLEGFPDDVIKFVCDPRTGLQRRMKWPPTISEVVEACEEHEAHLARVREARPVRLLPKPYEKPSANIGKVFVAAEHPQYRSLGVYKLEPYTAPDGRGGVFAPAELLVDLGMMKRGVL